MLDLETGRLVEWDHEEPENLGDVATSLDSMLRDGLEPWVEVLEGAVWSTLDFDFDSAILTPVGPEVLLWSELTRLEVGALLVVESSRRTHGLLNAGRDGEGGMGSLGLPRQPVVDESGPLRRRLETAVWLRGELGMMGARRCHRL